MKMWKALLRDEGRQHCLYALVRIYVEEMTVLKASIFIGSVDHARVRNSYGIPVPSVMLVNWDRAERVVPAVNLWSIPNHGYETVKLSPKILKNTTEIAHLLLPSIRECFILIARCWLLDLFGINVPRFDEGNDVHVGFLPKHEG